MTEQKPIVFLAFANSSANPLPRLGDEHNRLQAVLQQAQTRDWCEVIPAPYATLEEIKQTLEKERGRIAVFHFAGHANDYQLLLESADGKQAAAFAEGLATLLGQYPGLKLVFLNACSTQPHVDGLLQAGVSVVIATRQAIPDDVATELASQFYYYLACGNSINVAFKKAQAVVQTERGSALRSLGDAAQGDTPNDVSSLWRLRVRPGAEEMVNWNLPEAAKDPLFGLPPLPAGPLPSCPYRYLDWYRREDAEIFFGRGQAIRRLYQSITESSGAPVLLFYGQTGVGKSSVLAAGLFPRLEQTHAVAYGRRNPDTGLVGTLTATLAAAPPSQTPVTAPTSDAAGCLAAWLECEAVIGKPLTIILDQVEEVFTRPNREIGNELTDFLAIVHQLFGGAKQKPQGKLVLAFRKEYLAEIEKRMTGLGLWHRSEFLERLDRDGVLEIINGPIRSKRLQEQYHLQIPDETLPGLIADDLLKDLGSAVAPTLQILLTKLWERAPRTQGCPVFDRALYDTVSNEGLGLKDFLRQQMAELQASPAEPVRQAVSSGLVLDVLHAHVTDLDTAGQKERSNLDQEYRHQQECLHGALQGCVDKRLLVDVSQRSEPATRLAHDTLGPIVRAGFRESDAPGQRARRILENRGVDWQAGKEGTPLDEADLKLVEDGQAGMRAWQPDEERLVAASQRARQARISKEQRDEAEREAAHRREIENAHRLAEKEKERAKAAKQAQDEAEQRADSERKSRERQRYFLFWLTALLLVAIATAWFAFQQYGVANDQTTRALTQEGIANQQRSGAQTQEAIANQQRAAAQTQEAIANQQKSAAQTSEALAETRRQQLEQEARQTRLALAGQFAARADGMRTTYPQRALLLGVESLQVTLRANDPPNKASVDALQAILQMDIGGIGLGIQAVPIERIALSHDGRKLAAVSQDGTVQLWNVSTPGVSPRAFFTGAERWSARAAVAISPDNRWVAAANNGVIRVWDLENPQAVPRVLASSPSDLPALAFSSDSTLVSVGEDAVVRLWDLDASNLKPEATRLNGTPGTRPVEIGVPGSIPHLAISHNERWLAASAGGGYMDVWDLTAIDPATSHQVKQVDPYSPAILFGRDDRWLVSTAPKGNGALWDLSQSDAPAKLLPGVSYRCGLYSVAISSDGRWLISGQDNGDNLCLWDLDNFGEFRALPSLSLRTATAASLLPDFGRGTFLPVASGLSNPQLAVAVHTPNRVLIKAASDKAGWEPGNGASTPLLSAQRELSSLVAISPNNRWLAITLDNLAGLVDLDALNRGADATPILLRGHEAKIVGIAYSADNHWLVTASADRTARLWNLTPSMQAFTATTLSGNRVRIYGAATSADLLKLEPSQLIDLACRTAGRNLTRDEWKLYFGEQSYQANCSNLPGP